MAAVLYWSYFFVYHIIFLDSGVPMVTDPTLGPDAYPLAFCLQDTSKQHCST